MITQGHMVVDPSACSPHFLSQTYSGITPHTSRIFVKPPPINFLIDQPMPDRWIPEIREKMRGYLELPTNWDSYGGGPISNEVVAAAERFAELMAAIGFSRPKICPESSGGVLLEWQSPTQVLTVDFDETQVFSFSYESFEMPELDDEGGLDELVRGGFLKMPF